MLDRVAIDPEEVSDGQKTNPIQENKTIANDYPIDPLVLKLIDAAEPHVSTVTKPDMRFGLQVCARAGVEETYSCVPVPYALSRGMQDGADCAMIMEPPIPMYTMADKLDKPETRFHLRHKLMASWPRVDGGDSLRRLSTNDIYTSLLPANGKTAFQKALLSSSAGQNVPSVVLEGIVNSTLTIQQPEGGWLALAARAASAPRGAGESEAGLRTSWNREPSKVTDVIAALGNIIDHTPSSLEDEAVAAWHRKDKASEGAVVLGNPEPTPLPHAVLTEMRRIWLRLEVSKFDQLDLVIKYTSHQYCWRLNDVVRLWAAVATAMSRYEAGLEVLEAALSAMRVSHPKSIELCLQRVQALARLDFFSRDAISKVHSELGDHITRGKRPLLDWLTMQAKEAKLALEEAHV